MGYSEEIRDYVKKHEQMCRESNSISDELFLEYGVNRGLRDQNGKGVLVGLTTISKIVSKKKINGEKQPCEGELWYRGYRIEELVEMFKGDCWGFERTAYLLLFGEIAGDEEFEEFKTIIGKCRNLPTNFTRDVIMKASSHDIMNSMSRSILSLASYDEDSASNELGNCIRQCIQLMSVFPMLAVYGYHAYNHYENDDSMYIHRPDPNCSTAENILKMLRPDQKYTQLEAKVLDIALMLHMEHGGGNNSTFTTRVVTSSESDTYAAVTAAMSSLKGSRHGGANLKVMEMISDIKAHIDISDEKQIEAYLEKLLDKEAFDKKGLIYGMGHAVYAISDPRERIFKGFVEQLAAEKGKETELGLYNCIERLAPELIAKKRRIYKGVSPNVDFYSGFVYEMLSIPRELFTPLFSIARIAGWSAHRLEEIVGKGKIIRPAYMSIMKKKSHGVLESVIKEEN